MSGNNKIFCGPRLERLTDALYCCVSYRYHVKMNNFYVGNWLQ